MEIKIKGDFKIDKKKIQRFMEEALEDYIKREGKCGKCGSKNLKPDIFRVDRRIEGYVLCMDCNEKIRVIGEEEVQEKIEKILKNFEHTLKRTFK